jgi:hypothetical protein
MFLKRGYTDGHSIQKDAEFHSVMKMKSKAQGDITLHGD